MSSSHGRTSRFPPTAVLGCTIPMAVFAMLAVVLGSGILPIPLWLLISAAVAGAILMTLPAILLGRRRVVALLVLSGAAAIGTLIATMLIFGHFQKAGFILAKDYGQAVAGALTDARATTGAWPATLEELPAGAKPRLNVPWPYLAFCVDGVCRKVAGYFVEYTVDAGTPNLAVSRRDISARWNWTSNRFEETP